MGKKVVIRDSSKYAKMTDCNTGIVFYKDKTVEVPDDYPLPSEVEVYGEKKSSTKKRSSKKKAA